MHYSRRRSRHKKKRSESIKMAKVKPDTVIAPQEETKAIVDGFFLCRAGNGRTDLVQADTESDAKILFESINSTNCVSVDPSTVQPYGRDVVRLVGEIAVRRTWTGR